MFCRKIFYSKIEKIHHGTLKDDSYNDLLLRITIHQKYLQFLVTEIFKSISQTNLEFVWSFFKPKKLPYNLRKGPILNLPRTQSTNYGANAVHFRGSLVWSNLPAVV